MHFKSSSAGNCKVIRANLGSSRPLFFIGFLGLPVTIATQSVTHYIARFHFSSDNERLHGLLAGCRKFLLHITIVGSIAAVVLIKPLGNFFHIPRITLTVVALICVLAQFWSSFITALCQGLGWFKRLALILLLSAIIRFAFGASTTAFFPVAEWAVLASTVMLLSYFVLLFWRKEFPGKTKMAISPWSKEMIQFLALSTAWAVGSNCFCQYDPLVAQRYFSSTELDNYTSAGLLARQIPSLVGPLLAVLFTHRSGHHHSHHNQLRDQMKLLGLYAFGLVFNAIGLFALKSVGLRLLAHNTPAAAGMIAPFATSMVFIGLIQAIGTWALASRWIKISLLYGALGVAYWLALLLFGRTPATLLHLMPIAASIAFGLLFITWFAALRLHQVTTPEPS